MSVSVGFHKQQGNIKRQTFTGTLRKLKIQSADQKTILLCSPIESKYLIFNRISCMNLTSIITAYTFMCHSFSCRKLHKFLQIFLLNTSRSKLWKLQMMKRCGIVKIIKKLLSSRICHSDNNWQTFCKYGIVVRNMF